MNEISVNQFLQELTALSEKYNIYITLDENDPLFLPYLTAEKPNGTGYQVNNDTDVCHLSAYHSFRFGTSIICDYCGRTSNLNTDLIDNKVTHYCSSCSKRAMRDKSGYYL